MNIKTLISMVNGPRQHALLVGALSGLLLACGAAHAQVTATKEYEARVETSSGGLTAAVSIQKLSQGPWCGLEVKWGDGSSEQYRLTNDEPLKIEHTYSSAGAFPVVVDGKMVFRGLMSAFPCRGESSAFAVAIGSQATAAATNRAVEANPAATTGTAAVSAMATNTASGSSATSPGGNVVSNSSRSANAGPAVAVNTSNMSSTQVATRSASAAVQAPAAPPASVGTRQAIGAAASNGSAAVTLQDLPTLADDAQGRRVALLVGNAKYSNGINPLTNPGQDVQVMKTALQKIGFQVETVTDANKRKMQSALKDFTHQAQGATVAVFYYSGHGIQSSGENYLLPVDANIEKEADLDLEAMSLNGALKQIEEAHPRYTLIALDACRDNPVAKRTKSAKQGLARVGEQPTSSFVAFATQAGKTANDDGYFAKSLANRLTQPGVSLRTVFDLVARDVERLNGQEPLRLDGLRNDIFLAGMPAAPSAASPAKAVELPPLCRDQAGDALQACLKWQCQTDQGKPFAAACKNLI